MFTIIIILFIILICSIFINIFLIKKFLAIDDFLVSFKTNIYSSIISCNKLLEEDILSNASEVRDLVGEIYSIIRKLDSYKSILEQYERKK